MNKLVTYALTLAAVVTLTGCGTVESTGTGQGAVAGTVDKVTPYIRPATTAACSLVLALAVSPADRVDKAAIINKLATVVQSLAAGSTPTPSALAAAIEVVAPNKGHWARMIVTIKAVYAQAYDQYIKGDVKKAATVLHEIAAGAVDATSDVTGTN